MTDNEIWLKKYSEKLLREVGIKKGQTVLDFGCGKGNYTIPVAKIVGQDGFVYALDKSKSFKKLIHDNNYDKGYILNFTPLDRS